MTHRADSQQVPGLGEPSPPDSPPPCPHQTANSSCTPLHSCNFLGHFGWCLSRSLAVPAPPWHRPLAPLPTPSPASQPAWHQGGGLTFWKVTDLFWRGRGHRSMSCGHPGRALRQEHSCLHCSFTPLPAPGDTDASPASPTAGWAAAITFTSSPLEALPTPSPALPLQPVPTQPSASAPELE